MVAAALPAIVGGCSHETVEPQIPAKTPERFSESGARPIPSRWWREFEDEDLDGLVDQALAQNFSLAAAWDRLAQAEAIIKRTGAVQQPQADLTARASHSRTKNRGSRSHITAYSPGIAASFEVDLWSRLESATEAARLDAEATAEAVDTAAITLAASIADTWYQLAEAKALVRITEQQIETNRKVAEIVTVQFRKGQGSAADVLRQRQLVESTQSLLTLANERVELLQYTLSVLIGEPPRLGWEDESVRLPQLAPMPDTGLPADVLWRRPDVRRAYRQVQAADQRLAVAIADQYPRLSILSSYDTSGADLHSMFDDWVANIAANALQPLLDGGRRKAEVERNEAVVSERINAWGQAVLEALAEVETALTRQRQQVKFLTSLESQLELARETYERNRERFTKGQVDYIRVLESLQSLQSLEREVIRERRLLVSYRIDLYRAIAGSFEMERPLAARIDEYEASFANIQDEQVIE